MNSVIFFKSNNVQLAPHNQDGYFQKNIMTLNKTNHNILVLTRLTETS